MVPGQKERLELTARRSDTYAMIIDSGMNAVDIGQDSSKYAIDAARQVHLITYVGPLYIWLPAGVTSGGIELSSDIPAEGFQATLYDEDGNIMNSVIVRGEEVITLNLKSNPDGKAVRLEIQRLPDTVVEDVRIKILRGFSTYLCPSKEGLLE